MNSVFIPVLIDNPDILIPGYSRQGDAGIDLRSAEEITLHPFDRRLIPTGLKIAIPDGYAGLILPRSGLAAKHGISLVNSPGLIDSNYRGEIKVILINMDKKDSFEIKRGDRIAQLVIISIAQATFTLSDILPDSIRGEQGFGSSGLA